MNCIEVKNATKSYDNKNIVLNGLNLTVQIGSIYSLIGASGCGKTTILSCILGMKQLNSGTIKVLEEDVSYQSSSKYPHIIGYMPQETALVPELTIKETLNYFGNIFQMNQTLLKQRLVMICDLLELHDVKKRVKQLSGGEKRRVSLAAALIHDPKILILDEPTVGLDSILREKIWTFLIDSTRSSNMSVMITTHYISEAERSNRCGLMSSGKLLAEDSPKNIFYNLGVSNLEEAFYRLCLLKSLKTSQPVQDVDPHPCCSATEVQDFKPFDDANKTICTLVDTRKRFTGQTLKALYRKEIQRVRRQPVEIVFIFVLPILQALCFALAVGQNPIGLQLGIVNNEINDSNICLEYLKSTNYEFNSTSCYFKHLSCHFLNELQDESAIKVYYNSYEEAYKDAKAAKSYGFLTITSNFTDVMSERKNDWQYITEYTNFTDANLIQIYLDEGDFTISSFLRIRLWKAFERFNKKLLRHCNLNDKLEDSPMEIKTLYRQLEDNNIITVMPAMFSQVLLLSGILFSISSVAQCRMEGIWNRTILAGVTTSEILAVQIFIMLIYDVIQVFMFKLAFIFLFDIKIMGNEWLLVLICLLICMAGSSLGLIVSIHTNNVAIVNSAGVIIFFTCGGLCGGFWPIEGQPLILRYIGAILPTTLPTASIRNILAKGFTITHYTVYGGILLLSGYIIVVLAVSFLSLKKKKYS